MSKVLVLIKNKKDSLDIKQVIIHDYPKEIDPSSPLFYENLNEVDAAVKERYPEYNVISIQPTVTPSSTLDAFGNKIPFKKMNKDEAKKAGLL